MHSTNTFRSLLLACASISCTAVWADSPVAFEAILTPDSKDSKHLTLIITATIKEGLHMYSEVPESSGFQPVSVTVDLPKSVEKLGDLVVPVGMPYENNPNVSVFEGAVIYTQELKVVSTENSEIGITFNYQVCDSKKCMPATSWETKVAVPTGTPKLGAEGKKTFENQHFEAPVRLAVHGQPEQSLPSPALFDIDGDGRKELVSGSVTGDIQVFHNQNAGAGEPKWSVGRRLVATSGKQIMVHNWCCVGMTPQDVDLNGDGIKDIVVGCFEGVPQLIQGTKEGFLEPVSIKDANGNDVIISDYFDVKGNQWTSSDRAGGRGHATSASMVDWDSDGDFDLILGDKRFGGVYLRLNQGNPTQPSFSPTNKELMADGKPMGCKDGLSVARISDWDGDGLFDILCGGLNGGVNFFKNIGSKGTPAFAAAECLIEPVVKDVEKDLVPAVNGQPTLPAGNYHLEAYDYDGDGKQDLLVGAQSNWENPDYVPLTAEQQKSVAAKQEELSDLRKQWASKPVEARAEYQRTEEGRELLVKIRDLYKELTGPSTRPSFNGNAIWLFRRK